MWERTLQPTNNILNFHTKIMYLKMMRGNTVNFHGFFKKV